MHDNFKRVLREKYGATKFSVSVWQEEQKALRRQSEELFTQYKPIRERLDKMLNVQHCWKLHEKMIEKEDQEKKKSNRY